MKTLDALFGELRESLTEEERRLVDLRLEHIASWERGSQDPWVRFKARFEILRYNAHTDAYLRLQTAFASLLEDQGDPRGAAIRMQDELLDLNRRIAGLGEWLAPEGGEGLRMEDAFVEDIVAHPNDDVPLLAFADWLEERGDPRAAQVRLLTRVRELGRGIGGEWLEQVPVPWPYSPQAHHYDRFHDAARIVMQLTNQEAQRFNHEYLSTQHMLLALLRPLHDFGEASAALQHLSLCHDDAVAEVERITPTGPDMVTMGKLPQSPRCKAAVYFALQEADALGHDIVTPAHLLLGVCRCNPCVATRVLLVFGISPGAVCREVLARLGCDPGPWLRRRPEVW